jgi:hypothetical protein
MAYIPEVFHTFCNWLKIVFKSPLTKVLFSVLGCYSRRQIIQSPEITF